MLSKSRATLYATNSRAKQLQKDYLSSMHSEDLAFSSSNKKKDAERKLKLRVEQHQKEQKEIERKKVIKETLRIERDKKRFIENETAKMHAARKQMLREETNQKTVQELIYCQTIHVRFPQRGRTLQDVRGLLLQLQENQPSRTDAITQQLIERLKLDRKNLLRTHVRWRTRTLESMYTVLLHATKQSHVKATHAELRRLFQLDERRRRELFLWPKQRMATVQTEVVVPILAIDPLLEHTMRSDGSKCLHLLCHMSRSTPSSVGDKGTLAVQTLLTCGAHIDINATNSVGDTALHIAARSGSNAMVQLLLDFGANSRATNRVLETPMLCCVNRGYISTMTLLFRIGGGLPLLLDANRRGLTPLHIAVYSEYVLMVEQIVQWVRLGSQYKVVNRDAEWDVEKKQGVGKSKALQHRRTGCYHAAIAMEGQRHCVSNHFFTSAAEKTRLRMGAGGWKVKVHTARQQEQTKHQTSILAAVTRRGVTPLMCACYRQNVELIGMLSACMSTEEIALVDVDGCSASDYGRNDVRKGGKDQGLVVVDPMV